MAIIHFKDGKHSQHVLQKGKVYKTQKAHDHVGKFHSYVPLKYKASPPKSSTFVTEFHEKKRSLVSVLEQQSILESGGGLNLTNIMSQGWVDARGVIFLHCLRCNLPPLVLRFYYNIYVSVGGRCFEYRGKWKDSKLSEEFLPR